MGLSELWVKHKSSLKDKKNQNYLVYSGPISNKISGNTINIDGEEVYDWYWYNPEGEVVAYSDLQFRDTVFESLLNRFNEEAWSEIDAFGVVSPVVGFDFYHYKNNFWLHAYGSYLLPYHKYVSGDEDFSYLNRNNWGLGGLRQDSELEQWDDYQAGVVFGWKLNKNIGVFVEGEYTKFWDSKIYNSSVGLNITLK